MIARGGAALAPDATDRISADIRSGTVQAAADLPDGEEARWGLALASLPDLGSQRRGLLMDAFPSARAALSASAAEWAHVLGPRAAAAARRRDPDWGWVEAQLRSLGRHEGYAVTSTDPAYPPRLTQIPDPPPLLYVLGAADPGAPAVAIVGTRRCTGYGRAVARQLGCDLARRGITVVSGMARGIDTAAHEGALEGGGATVAVLGCGADVVYPAQNRGLYRCILASGAVVSELPMGVRPEAGSFPRRNRIISGLSLGVAVVETPARSGALITASCALDQNREVFAVPGDVTDGRSAGCHRLLKDGACLVEGVEDVVEELAPLLPAWAAAPAEELTPQLGLTEGRVLERLDTRGRHVDALARETGMAPAELLEALLRLELEGVVVQLPGQYYCRR